VPEVDLAIEGGTVVSPDGRRFANVLVKDGRVVHVGPDRASATATVDAGGLMVLPGGVDTHVHLMDPGAPEREDFISGSSAAAASGVTTILEHTHGHPIRTVDDLTAKREHLEERSLVDYGLAAHAWPDSQQDVHGLWAAGVAFFKLFTCTTHGVPGHNAAQALRHLRAAATSGANTLMHCEDESITEGAEKLLRATGRLDGGIIPEWRNREAELVAVSVASLLVRVSGARTTIAHVSNPEAVALVARERSLGAPLAAEACPQYFLLREPEVLELGALRKFTPPARARTDHDEAVMWSLLRDGSLTHISTDHAPATLDQKRDGDIWSVHFGLPGLDSTMSLLLDAVARGEISFEDLVRVYSYAPARRYGLFPRKGQLAVGADADVVLVDPYRRRTLRDEDVLSKAGWTPYAGREITGAVVRTYLRGRLIAEEGKPLDNRTGRFLPGAGATGTAQSP
jgi:dihydroorotase (multifunctional complex type)